MGMRLRSAQVAGALILVLGAPLGAQQFEKKLSLAQTSIGYGARALALGGAFIAIADDITAMSYNPAGLAQLLRPELSLGLSTTHQSYFLPRSDQSSIGGYDSFQDNSSLIQYSFARFEYAGAVMPFKIGRLPIVLGIGFQTKTNERAKSQYQHDSDATADDGGFRLIQKRTISGDDFGAMNVITLSLAARPVEFLHVGINANYWWQSVETNSQYRAHEFIYYSGALWYEDFDTIVKHSEKRASNGFNADLGLLLKFRSVAAGLVYKTRFSLDYRSSYSGARFFHQVGDGTMVSRAEWEAVGTARWPYSLGAGISARPFDLLTISADYTFSNWSDGQIIWETPPPDTVSPQGYPVEAPCNIHQYRVGVEALPYLGNKLKVAVRAGWFSDQAYWTDIDGRPIPFHGLTFGVGMIMARSSIDVAAVRYSGSYKAWQYYIEDERQASWHILASFSFKIGK
jgi:long-chain fatty acid transport protein